MIRTNNRVRLCAALLVLNLMFIWGNSLMPAEISQAFSDWVKELLAKLLPGGSSSPTQGSGLIRKIAHFTEFMALGILLTWLFGMLQKAIHLPFLTGAAAACIDETIQFFVPGRAPGIKDMCIDCCGVLVGLALLTIGHHYVKKRSTHIILEDK